MDTRLIIDSKRYKLKIEILCLSSYFGGYFFVLRVLRLPFDRTIPFIKVKYKNSPVTFVITQFYKKCTTCHGERSQHN